ncbi:hypothetical protein VNO78_33354 [Psophocarpus tetragonolobus]|uniref:Protein kinase domain-containing protein n=1 Tax=Psophocarpus tetragonolobus TaxID=3891 RepID=A0AAN9NWU1_PSOTE
MMVCNLTMMSLSRGNPCKACDLTHQKIVTLKRVRFDNIDMERLASSPTIKFSEPLISFYSCSLLFYMKLNATCLDDIKGSNLLIDNNGILKIADFGLTKFIDPHHKVALEPWAGRPGLSLLFCSRHEKDAQKRGGLSLLPDLERYYESSVPDSITATIWFTGTTKKSHAYVTTVTDGLIILDPGLSCFWFPFPSSY